jgi:hydroxymethylglutaryl-CoA synthase
MSGIVSYGIYLPYYRITLDKIAEAWDKNPQEIISALQVIEKTVPNYDEDAISMGVEASLAAFAKSSVKVKDIESVYVGSESHPYAVNPSSSTIAEILGIGPHYFAADLEFACKAGTAGISITVGLLESKKIKFGLVIGSDTAQAKPRDVLEFTAASAAGAFILGNDQEQIIANVTAMSSFTSDTPDFWRRDGSKYPSHAGRFTGEPAYFHHVISEGKQLLAQSGLQPKDFDYCVFHMPNGKFPKIAAKKLGFTEEQIAPSFTVKKIGNPYTASSLVGLAAVLDIAKPGQKIFFVSYGSGAGSDGFIFETTKNITKMQNQKNTVAEQIEHKKNIEYLDFLKKTRKI